MTSSTIPESGFFLLDHSMSHLRDGMNIKLEARIDETSSHFMVEIRMPFSLALRQST